MSFVAAKIRGILGHELEEVVRDTAVVYLTPSQYDIEYVRKMAAEMPLDESLKDFGTRMAMDFANQLELAGLRPAAYASLEDIQEIFAKRLSEALGKNPPEFYKSFFQVLASRG